MPIFSKRLHFYFFYFLECHIFYHKCMGVTIFVTFNKNLSLFWTWTTFQFRMIKWMKEFVFENWLILVKSFYFLHFIKIFAMCPHHIWHEIYENVLCNDWREEKKKKKKRFYLLFRRPKFTPIMEENIWLKLPKARRGYIYRTQYSSKNIPKIRNMIDIK